MMERALPIRNHHNFGAWFRKGFLAFIIPIRTNPVKNMFTRPGKAEGFIALGSVPLPLVHGTTRVLYRNVAPTQAVDWNLIRWAAAGGRSLRRQERSGGLPNQLPRKADAEFPLIRAWPSLQSPRDEETLVRVELD